MSTQITTTLYKFAELAPAVQQKVIDRNRDFNVSDDWWFTPELEYFASDLLAPAGFIVKPDDIHFSGFGNQGDGASFKGTVDILAFMHAHKLCNALRALYCAIKRGVDIEVSVQESRQGYFVYTELTLYLYQEDCKNEDQYNVITAQADQLESIIKDAAESLAKKMYRDLEQVYECAISDESIKESIQANELDFTASGLMPRL